MIHGSFFSSIPGDGILLSDGFADSDASILPDFQKRQLRPVFGVLGLVTALDSVLVKTVGRVVFRPVGARKTPAENEFRRGIFLMICPSESGDLRDLDGHIFLTVTRSLFGSLAAAEFLDVNLFAPGFTDHAGGNFGTLDSRLAQPESLTVTDRQNPIESQFGTGFQFAEIDFQCLAFFNFVLASAVSNNRVHLSC
jgi:hypothetical protein